MRLLTLVACIASCKACNPQISPNFDTSPDSDPEEETGDSTDSMVDTSPPPMCEQIEVEPNNNDGEATVIVREKEACGEFGGGLDLDFYEFETRTAGWLEIDVASAERGTAADVNLSMESDDGLQLTMQDGAGSADPYVLVPVPGPDTWFLILNEERVQGGEDDYEYFFHVSEAKAPFVADANELDEHDSWETAQPITVDELVYGTLENNDERDWYVLETPAEKVQLRAEITAHRMGSPLDAKLILWKLDKDTNELSDSWEEWADTNPFDVGLDPAFERTGGGGEVWYLQVLKSTGGTGPLYWYTIHISEVAE